MLTSGEVPKIISEKIIIGIKVIIRLPHMLAYRSPIGPNRKVWSNAIPIHLGDFVTKNGAVMSNYFFSTSIILIYLNINQIMV